ncbi:MAG TPA: hypothetical protein VMD51_07870 [Mycobacterium sp.]|nr:hypothetical protein [Mycobacterium sp.]
MGTSYGAPACSSRRRLTRTLPAIALLAGITTVAPGCGAPENLAQAADSLQAALASMPGVSDAWVYHEQSYAEGVAVNIAVDVSNATPEQIAGVADRIDATRFGLIANYAQNVEFWVTPNRAVTLQRHNELDPAQIADDSQRLRQIAEGTDGRIDWFRSDDGTVNQLSFDRSHSSGTTILDAVRTAAGATGLSVSVSPAAASRQTPRMLVNFPIDPAEQKSVFDMVNSIPADAVGLRMDAAGLQALEVVAHDPSAAEKDLSKVITASDTVSARPMWLAWYYPTFAGGAPAYGGVVKVGSCGQGPAIQTVADRSSDGVSTLQSRLQSSIDSCGAPVPAPTQAQWTPPSTPLQPTPSTPVIEVVAPDRVQGPATSIAMPRPVRRPTTTIVAAPGDGPQRGSSGPSISSAVRPVPAVPTQLPIPLPVGAVDPSAGSGSSTGSGTGTGTGSGSTAPTATGSASSGARGSVSSRPTRHVRP